MKNLRSVVIVATTTLLLSLSFSAAMAKDEPKKIGNAVRAIKEFTAVKNERIPPELLKNANGIVIIPGASKNNFMASGGSAGGVLLVRDTDGKWSSPVFITLSGGTLGWQIISDPMDIILIFKNRKRIDEVMKGKFTLDAKVAVVPGPVRLSTKAATKEEKDTEISWYMRTNPIDNKNSEINYYIRSQGKFAGATVDTTTVQIDAASNDVFYGKQKVNTGDILSGKVEKSSDDVKILQKLLAEYAASK
jgi:lipid-binding SYLF domain-containing protein